MTRLKNDLELNWFKYLELCENLSIKIKEKFDNLLLVGTGGWIVGKIINKKLRLPISTLICMSYDGKTRHEVKMSSIIPERELLGRVLIVDDIIDTGTTMIKLKNLVMNEYDNITTIKIAALIKKSKSKVFPDFFVMETDKWVIFPYEPK
ncbi:MAG: phosphoribosyltransferase [Candidatus Helarchaeota archaeon]